MISSMAKGSIYLPMAIDFKALFEMESPSMAYSHSAPGPSIKATLKRGANGDMANSNNLKIKTVKGMSMMANGIKI